MKAAMKTYVSPAKHFTVAALALLTASAAHAQTWNGGGTDNNWSTPANWTGGAPANNGTATVNFTTGTRPTSNVDTAWNINTISITYSGNRTIQGSDITFTQSGATSIFYQCKYVSVGHADD